MLAETHHFVSNNLNVFQKERLQKVEAYIEGFENAFGLELLATVAFAVKQCPTCTKEEIIANIQNWTDRKRELMSEHLINVAYERVIAFH